LDSGGGCGAIVNDLYNNMYHVIKSSELQITHTENINTSDIGRENSGSDNGEREKRQIKRTSNMSAIYEE